MKKTDEIAGLNIKLEGFGLSLKYEDDILCLTDGKLSMNGDFSELLKRLRYNNLTHELVIKAAKIKNIERPLKIIDATAGMGEDSLLLAAAGHNVIMYEYDPVIAALLENTLERAMKIPELISVASRMCLIEGNSIDAMREIRRREKHEAATEDEDRKNSMHMDVPDVILLDPMFPQRQKSGLIKKKFQLLQQLESPCANEAELLDAAISSGTRKIIIKRPAKGPYLAGKRPDYSLEGKAVRYDCHVITP